MTTTNEVPPLAPSTTWTIGHAIAALLRRYGVDAVFAVPGAGATGLLNPLIEAAGVTAIQMKHESAAGFAALEYSLAATNDRVAAVVVTTGPGALNALTGLAACRADGGRVVALIPLTPDRERGSDPVQETTEALLGPLARPGPICTDVVRVDGVASLAALERSLATALRRPGGAVLSVLVPTDVQTMPAPGQRRPGPPLVASEPAPVPARRLRRAATLLGDNFAVWVGFGARRAAAEVAGLLDGTGAGAFCSPRALGVVPPGYPGFVGPSGVGGRNAQINDYLRTCRPQALLVLGSRLGGGTRAGVDIELLPPTIVRVDADPSVAGRPFAGRRSFGLTGDVATVVSDLSPLLPSVAPSGPAPERWDNVRRWPAAADGPVRPLVVCGSLQRLGFDWTEFWMAADSGTSFIWAVHELRPTRPGQLRTSPSWGAMGLSNGAIGAALARRGPVVALIGDAAFQMHCEVNTAISYSLPVCYVVLNSSGSLMVEQGLRATGASAAAIEWTRCAPSRFGALGGVYPGCATWRVENEADLEGALEEALAVRDGPSIVDVLIDTTQAAPIGARVEQVLNLGGAR